MKVIARTAVLTAVGLVLAACGDAGTDEVDTGVAPASESVTDSPVDAVAAEEMEPDVGERIRVAMNGEHRSPGNAERNAFRHPVETLQFFGLEPGMTVVELWPGGGSAWYTEILAPAIGMDGKLIAATWSLDSDVEYFARNTAAFIDKIEARPEIYGNVEVVQYENPDRVDLAEPGTVDLVLLSRVYHNIIRAGSSSEILADAHLALKPGGILAVVQHRSPEDAPDESEQRDGYVKPSRVIADAEAAGFELAARSEINANPEDDHDHPQGVWSLPPSLALCGEIQDESKKAECVAEWTAIGESDRMTLKFVKPAA